MLDWIDTTRLVDLALGCTVLEAAFLWAIRHRWLGTATARGVAANLAAGALLMLAIRIAASGGHWMLVAACLLCALAAHVVDLLDRTRLQPVIDRSR